MKRKKKNLIILAAVLLVLTSVGTINVYFVQNRSIEEKENKVLQLRAGYSSIEDLKKQLNSISKEAMSIDSLLFNGLYSIPKNLTHSAFFGFIDQHSQDNSFYTFTNIEYKGGGTENEFNYYNYDVSGNGRYEDVYRLIYAIEHSKELKKINSAELSATTSVDKKGVPVYLVKFLLKVQVYYSASDQYALMNHIEDKVFSSYAYDAFYPLVRSSILPNINNLPDIQDATLASLIPQGAFITDTKGNTILLKKGDPVYLGYLTDIDYEKEQVTFVLNKGGVVENLILKLGQVNKREGI